MSNFIGHTNVKLDAKGRFTFPSAFKKQLESTDSDVFIIKKDIYDQCLILYTKETWQQLVGNLQSKLNPYNRQHNMFLRKFFMDTAELTLDANNRLLLPKRLLELANIEKDLLLIGVGNKIELWNPQIFEANSLSDEEFTNLAETLLGNNPIEL